MARVIPPGYAEARFVMKALGDPDPYICTMGLSVAEAGGDFEACAQTAAGAWLAGILPGQSTSLTLTQVDLLVGQDGEDPLIVTRVVGTAGSTASNMLPQNCAVLVQKRTGLAGRANRGRFYIPLLAREAQVDQYGTIDSAERSDYQASVQTFFDRLISPEGDTPQCPAVILHNSKGADTPSPTLITSLLVDPVIATQRRRLR